MNAPHRPPRRKVDGVILLDKPTGISSNAALQRVRRIFNAAKGGHTGTLDPLASGLLPLCFGEATKFSQSLLDADKAYEAELRLGVRTDTGDAEGRVIESKPVAVSAVEFAAACAKLTGVIEQTPPMYSALKVAGRPLYDYAREGLTLERKARRVTVKSIEVLGFETDTARIAVACSKGTYIRVLAEDIGAYLGCGAHLVSLRRTGIGRFCIDEAVELARLEESPGAAGQWLLPTDFLLAGWSELVLEEHAAQKFTHGQAVAFSAPVGYGSVRVYSQAGRFLGAADHENGLLRPRRLVSENESAEQPRENGAGY